MQKRDITRGKRWAWGIPVVLVIPLSIETLGLGEWWHKLAMNTKVEQFRHLG
jgi:hypothetical protein